MTDGEIFAQRQALLTFSRVEDTVGLCVAYVAAFGLAVVLQSTGLTEVVPAPGRHWTGQHTAQGDAQKVCTVEKKQRKRLTL